MGPGETSAPLITVAVFHNLQEADLAQSLLESCEIASFLCDEHTHNLTPYFGDAIGGLRLQVAEADFDIAKELLKDFSKQKGAFPYFGSNG